MTRVRIPFHSWRAWIQYSLPHLLIIMDLIVSTASIHDDVPPPMFLPGASNITVREGDNAILPCAVKHLGTKQVAWRRIDADDFLTIGKMTWIEDENFAIDFSDKGNDITNWNLVIDKVSPEYAGIYECQVTSKLGYNKLVKLNVVGPPITDPVISITGKRYVDIGEEIHLVCNVSGGSRIPEDIDWFKDGDMIDSFKYPRVLIAKYQSIRDRAFISELKIDRARLRDTGEYVCRSSRDHIVNMKVTVLRAASPNFRRGAHLPNNGSGSDAGSRACSGLCIQTLSLLLLTNFLANWMLCS